MIEKIKNFFSPQDISHVFSHADLIQMKFFEKGGSAIDFKKSFNRTLVSEYMLLKKLPVIKENYDRFLMPYYSNFNCYLPKAKINKHTSSKKHDITVLVNLYQENQWKTYFKDLKKNKIYEQDLNGNEAFVYDGNRYEMWRDTYKGKNKYLEFEAHYLCNCTLCIEDTYCGLVLDPLTNIIYQKLKENFVQHHKNNTYEHVHHQLNETTKKYAILENKIKNLQEKLKKYES
tara:strand:- start:5 stop:697 length:693 start_codon:yes stop_codon:yes gene_type:complete